MTTRRAKVTVSVGYLVEVDGSFDSVDHLLRRLVPYGDRATGGDVGLAGCDHLVSHLEGPLHTARGPHDVDSTLSSTVIDPHSIWLTK